jgi:hypothetical protein
MAWFRRRRRSEEGGGTPANGGNGGTPAVNVGPVNDAERRWIDDQLNRLHTSGVDLEDPAQLGAYYDRLLSHWLSADNGRPDPNPDINLIGIGLGEHLRHRTGLQWAVVTDAKGAEIALHGQPGDILIYPTNAVAKRWVAHQAGFLPSFADEVVRSVEEIRSGSRP